ncbi:hypothetical protein IF1G_11412 [Cordyceps javanica]|uniref:Uncharacterized protein n=1 Tax=Cordyceps javanica TaxID=43265 RepID=A0A545UKD4_9HYPO|nr:hypothetical protein IF1G_11412 [Cordyceps javanica]
MVHSRNAQISRWSRISRLKTRRKPLTWPLSVKDIFRLERIIVGCGPANGMRDVISGTTRGDNFY